jgi:hypothetical protein
MNFFNTLRQDFLAWLRSERRVAPRGVRGRVYAGDKDPLPPVVRLSPPRTATLHMVVTRADGSVEKITVPAQVTSHG